MNLLFGNMEKVAIFDIDGTLIKGISSERVFFRYLLAKKIIKYRDLLRFAWVLIKKLFSFKGIYARKNKFHLKGKSYELLAAEARKCFDEKISRYISSDGIAELKRLKQNGYKIILLTGTLDPIMECFKAYCNADEGIGTTLKTADGIVVGEIDGLYAYHTAKAEIVQKLAQGGNIDLSKSYAFANEVIDIDFMQLVGTPVAVNPDPSLKEHAEKNNWKVVEFAT
ncbi:MAG: HAD family hydrolase [Candidatus Anammoxibacter sp.]